MNIYLFHGADNYSSYQKLRFWQKEFAKKYGEESIEVLDGKELKPAEFSTNIEALPLFSEKRFIVVKSFLENGKTEEQKKVADQLDRATEESIIIFHENGQADKRTSLYKKLVKIGKVEDFKALEPIDIAKWITDQKELNIGFANANYLSQICEPSLWSISTELEKLKTYANGQEITREMIDDITTASLSSSIFKLTDSIALKNTKDSLKTLKILTDSGEDLIRIFYMIARHFRILIQVKDMVEKGEQAFSIQKKLKQHPFVIQKTSSQSRNFQLTDLEKLHAEFLNLDRKFKTGIIKSYAQDNRELKLAIEKLIIDCCHKTV